MSGAAPSRSWRVDVGDKSLPSTSVVPPPAATPSNASPPWLSPSGVEASGVSLPDGGMGATSSGAAAAAHGGRHGPLGGSSSGGSSAPQPVAGSASTQRRRRRAADAVAASAVRPPVLASLAERGRPRGDGAGVDSDGRSSSSSGSDDAGCAGGGVAIGMPLTAGGNTGVSGGGGGADVNCGPSRRLVHASSNALCGTTAITINNNSGSSGNLAGMNAAPGANNGGGANANANSVSAVVWQRLSVLVSLLLLQSGSQFILEVYEGLITTNVVIPLFLTMLVGAGGNAGNQAAVRSITGMATGEFGPRAFWTVVRRESLVGLICASVLFAISGLRVVYYYSMEDSVPTPLVPTVFAIAFSLFCIVVVSVVLGAALPFGLLRFGVNVEHAAPAIQVVMDILGVFISCWVCSMFLPSTPPPPAVGRPPLPVVGGGGAAAGAVHAGAAAGLAASALPAQTLSR